MIADFVPTITSIEEGLLYLTPEPRSPHGVDVAPKVTLSWCPES